MLVKNIAIKCMVFRNIGINSDFVLFCDTFS